MRNSAIKLIPSKLDPAALIELSQKRLLHIRSGVRGKNDNCYWTNSIESAANFSLLTLKTTMDMAENQGTQALDSLDCFGTHFCQVFIL